MLHEPYFGNEGPFLIPNFEGFLFAEKFRKSASYLTSWQKEWRILWMRSKNKFPLNIYKLAEEKLRNDNGPYVSHFRRLYDARQGNSIFVSENLPFMNTFADVGEFMQYTREISIEWEMNGQFGQNINGLKLLMNAVLENQLNSLQLSPFVSHVDVRDPLHSFDNPLWRMQNVDNELKASTLQVGPTGGICPFQTPDHNLSIINVAHFGCKAWIVIHPSSTQRLLLKIGDCAYPNGVPQMAFNCIIRNKNYIFTLDQLNLWGIQYTVVFQEEGDVVIALPGVIYATCNLTFCIDSSMKFISLVKEDMELIRTYQECTCCCRSDTGTQDGVQFSTKHGIWVPEIPRTIDKVIWEWMRIALLEQNLSPSPTNTSKEFEFPDSIMEHNETSQPPTDTTPLMVSEDWDVVHGLQNLECDPFCCGLRNGENFLSPLQFGSDKSADTLNCENANTTWSNGKVGSIEANEGDPQRDVLYNEYYKICTEIEEFCAQMDNFAVQTPNITQISELDTSNSFTHNITVPTYHSSILTSQGGVDCPVVSEIDLKETLIRELDIVTAKSFDQIYENNQNVRPDQKKHGYSCPECCRQLSSKAHLQRHLYLKHSPEDISVQCPICLKMFANQVSLQRHRRPVSNHPSRKRNLCRGLTERIGDDNRLRCEICGQLFVQKSGYNRHFKNKHKRG